MQGGKFPDMGGQAPFSGRNGLQEGQVDPSVENIPQGMNRPDWGNSGAPVGERSSNTEYLIVIVVLFALLAGATIFVARPRKHML